MGEVEWQSQQEERVAKGENWGARLKYVPFNPIRREPRLAEKGITGRSPERRKKEKPKNQ